MYQNLFECRTGESTAEPQFTFRKFEIFFYQLAFVTPGISPESDSCRKQMRQRWNIRRKPRGRPQRLHRLWYRTANFFFFASLATAEVRAILKTPDPH
jgi:hypothetical protein